MEAILKLTNKPPNVAGTYWWEPTKGESPIIIEVYCPDNRIGYGPNNTLVFGYCLKLGNHELPVEALAGRWARIPSPKG